MSHVQVFNLALQSDKNVLPSISYPWSGSSAPLVFSKTTRPEIPVAIPNVPTPNTCLDTCSVRDAFYGVGMLIWHNFSMTFQKLKLIKQKIFGVRDTSPSVTASV